MIAVYVFGSGITATRAGREVHIRGLEPRMVHRLRGRAARYARRIMFDGAAKLPNNGTTWEMASLGIVVDDPSASTKLLTRRRLLVGAALTTALAVLVAWTVPRLDGDGMELAPAPEREMVSPAVSVAARTPAS